MKIKKKGFAKKTVSVIFSIICVPLFLLALLVLILMIPFDYIKYKTTRYFKDTREKYTLLSGMGYYVTLYNAIKENSLQVSYYRDKSVKITGYGYFVHEDILILNDCEAVYDEEENIWTVEIDDEYVNIEKHISASLEQCNEFFKSEFCTRAAVLVDETVLNNAPSLSFDKLEFIPVRKKDYASALKAYLYKNF